MKNLIRLEEMALLGMTYYLFLELPYVWWLYFALLFLPDLSMAGYLFNNKAGAIFYNIVHHRGLAIILYLLGIATGMNMIALTGLILLGHSTLDRIMNYGLKYFKGFKHTSLGEI